MVGGVGFLVKYDGQEFTDLTAELNHVLHTPFAVDACCDAVNALAWNGTEWMIAGGIPIAVTYSLKPINAWAVTYDGHRFTDISPLLPTEGNHPHENSSILTVTHSADSWFFGGYANGHGLLLSYRNSAITDLSYLIKGGVSIVNWVGGKESFSRPMSNSSPGYFANYLSFLFVISLGVIIAVAALLIFRPSLPRPRSQSLRLRRRKSKRRSRPSAS